MQLVKMSFNCRLHFNLTEKRMSGVKEITDLEGAIEVQTRQIFLGMVAMQHEACMDMVSQSINESW